ncbi:dTDP-4-dehydrorhamnose reductase [Paenibacillaceae bacterium WGS1546]|uniref:dTDP-4-dehydrorhamnose reductase n=1 Tax=Cohnella sp. WGS1546 TaxID=3366810 RepID=UPI00372D5B2D
MSRQQPIVLVTGARGQLGQELVRMPSNRFRMMGASRAELDVTDREQTLNIIKAAQPDVVIHAAAYTAVDQAESEPERAWVVNVEGTRNVARAAENAGAKLIYISTDYVFDGMGTTPYREDHHTNPGTVYGKTKLEGERASAENASRLFIVRTSWVYGEYGPNFVKTMLRLAQRRRELSVVEDQIGSPTYTYDLAKFLLELASTEKYGVYHASNRGQCSWYEFAKEIFAEAGMTEIDVLPCSTEQYPRPAPRPSYSVLGDTALVEAGFAPLRPWREALREFLSKSGGEFSYIFPRVP